MMKHVFIVGSKGIPAQYGGYETFVEQLTAKKTTDVVQYHVLCKTNEKFGENDRYFKHNNAECIRIHVPNLGPAQAIYYDLAALNTTIQIVKQRNIQSPIFYILACRIGPFMKHYVKLIHRLGGVVYINPDGHEWMRAKWSRPVKKYLKLCEQLMVKYADKVICDSDGIQDYIQATYRRYSPDTCFIAYGADPKKSALQDSDPKFVSWLQQHGLSLGEYYLIVGRFVPENNYETMIREFMKSKTTKSLVIITNVERNKFYEKLLKSTHFDNDRRIKFVGTVYDQELLKKIREKAYGYLHGHSVGGTNPSLLEALASTKLNLLFDVKFNREVGADGALYWTKSDGVLSNQINELDKLPNSKIDEYSKLSTRQVVERYSWKKIVDQYERLFLTF